MGSEMCIRDSFRNGALRKLLSSVKYLSTNVLVLLRIPFNYDFVELRVE